MIRDAVPEDAEQIAAIYDYYVNTSTATFELEPPSAGEMRRRIVDVQKTHLWIVEEENGKILGYAYAGQYKERPAYRFTTELAVYVDRNHRGKKIGPILTRAVLERLKGMPYYTAFACITSENLKSMQMVEELGFELVGRAHNVGRKFGKWLGIVDYTLPIKPYPDKIPEEE